MTERERAEAVVRDKQRQWVWNLVGLTALVLSVGLAALAAWGWQQRADAAEQNVVSFAQQVQDACADGGLPVDGRDLCPRADEIVEDPAAPPVPPAAEDGDDAPPPTDAQVAAGVSAWFATHDLSLTSGYSAAMETAVARSLSRNPPPPGKPGPAPTDRQIAGAVAAYLMAHPPAGGTDGANGTDGRGLVSASLDGCHVLFTYTDGSTDRVGPICGADGQDGEKGDAGVGMEDLTCPDDEDDDWLLTFTDGTTKTIAGPCRVDPEPDPTPSLDPGPDPIIPRPEEDA